MVGRSSKQGHTKRINPYHTHSDSWDNIILYRSLFVALFQCRIWGNNMYSLKKKEKRKKKGGGGKPEPSGLSFFSSSSVSPENLENV